MVDMVVHRHQLRATLSRVVRILVKAPPLPPVQKSNGNGNSGEEQTALVPVDQD
jgi:hypothetical protein